MCAGNCREASAGLRGEGSARQAESRGGKTTKVSVSTSNLVPSVMGSCGRDGRMEGGNSII